MPDRRQRPRRLPRRKTSLHRNHSGKGCNITEILNLRAKPPTSSNTPSFSTNVAKSAIARLTVRHFVPRTSLSTSARVRVGVLPAETGAQRSGIEVQRPIRCGRGQRSVGCRGGCSRYASVSEPASSADDYMRSPPVIAESKFSSPASSWVETSWARSGRTSQRRLARARAKLSTALLKASTGIQGSLSEPVR